MTDSFLIKIEKLINSELSSKILSSKIEFNELILKISHNEILEVIQFLKFDDRLKFRQLIDIAAIDYPNEEKRFEIVGAVIKSPFLPTYFLLIKKLRSKVMYE